MSGNVQNTELSARLSQLAGLDVYEESISEADGAVFFLGRKDLEKFVGAVGGAGLSGRNVGELDGQPVTVGPTNHENAGVLRKALEWTGPRLGGLATSIGLGDRLGLATPGHVRAVRGRGLFPVFAQQSIREMTRTGRTAEEVLDCATWGVFQEGFRDGFGADADHLQEPKDIDATAAAGFRMFTIDPGAYVEDAADEMPDDALAKKFAKLDFEALEVRPQNLTDMYEGRTFALKDGRSVGFDYEALLIAAVKYGGAIAHTAKMYRHLQEVVDGEFEVEVSVDETTYPTSVAEHYFFAEELKRLGVKFVALAPRFVGRFEKGVDYIGDIDAFRASFAEHVAVMRTVGPYKISIHSGSDKFSIYPIAAELADGLVHVKTAGTSYLEALRAVSEIEPALFRQIVDFARRRYDKDKATYHVSADASKVPEAEELKDADLPGLLNDFNAREVLHVTYGSVLKARRGKQFREPILKSLKQAEEVHYARLAEHLGRHVAPFARK